MSAWEAGEELFFYAGKLYATSISGLVTDSAKKESFSVEEMNNLILELAEKAKGETTDLEASAEERAGLAVELNTTIEELLTKINEAPEEREGVTHGAKASAEKRLREIANLIHYDELKNYLEEIPSPPGLVTLEARVMRGLIRTLKQEMAELDKEYMDLGAFQSAEVEKVPYEEIQALKEFAENDFRIACRLDQDMLNRANRESMKKAQWRHKQLIFQEDREEAVEKNLKLGNIDEILEPKALVDKKNFHLYEMWKRAYELHKEGYQFILWESKRWPEGKVFATKNTKLAEAGEPLPEAAAGDSSNVLEKRSKEKRTGQVREAYTDSIEQFAAGFLEKIGFVITLETLAKNPRLLKYPELQAIETNNLDISQVHVRDASGNIIPTTLRMWSRAENAEKQGKKFILIQEDPAQPPRVYATSSQEILDMGTETPGAVVGDISAEIDFSQIPNFDRRLHPKRITEDYVDELETKATSFQLDKETCPTVTNKILHRYKINLEDIGVRVSHIPARPKHQFEEFQSTPNEDRVNNILAWEKILALYEKAKARQGPSLFWYNKEIYIVHERISDRIKDHKANAVLKEARGWNKKEVAEKRALEILEAKKPYLAAIIKKPSEAGRIPLLPTRRKSVNHAKYEFSRLQKIIDQELTKGIPPSEIPDDIISRTAVI